MWNYNFILSCILSFPLFVYAEIISSNPDVDECTKISSCSTCITKTECTWCVTKSKCTQQSCGNDNIIYPQQISAIMSGPTFCPKVVEPEEILTVKSGTKDGLVVKITQIHLYMAFTPWKCRISINAHGASCSKWKKKSGFAIFCFTIVYFFVILAT
ncbi:hypothetical protein O3G_MSEX006813 [Manduca sexta]|uniref:PSI domain-containing protein n=1 Tax=Manduca sexta TaxID=7130 RepID=A0A921Z3Z4_MANSE|nr:hypothetical protein O3G_MSEX006813 [Manduca sexta]